MNKLGNIRWRMANKGFDQVFRLWTPDRQTRPCYRRDDVDDL
jgi:hypothetical protein